MGSDCINNLTFPSKAFQEYCVEEQPVKDVISKRKTSLKKKPKDLFNLEIIKAPNLFLFQ